MSPSADRPAGARSQGGRLSVLAAVSSLALVGGSTPLLRANAATPSPSPSLATRSPGPVAAAPVLAITATPLDISAPVLALVLTTSNLDGSLTDATGPRARVLTLAADVVFAFGKSQLAPAARSRLHEVAVDIRTAAGKAPVQLQVDGYTDSVGADAYNVTLSTGRAQSVAAALRTLLPGAAVTFVVHGHGAADPVAPNTTNGKDNPKGRALNRRVTVTFANPPASP